MGDLWVTGPAVHTAARIQQAAEPDQILLSARTLRAARDMVEGGPAERIDVRGQRQPVEVVEVLGLARCSPPTCTASDLPRLIAALDHAAHHNRLVLLVGDAGVGKSTLASGGHGRDRRPRPRPLGTLPAGLAEPALRPVREVLAAAAGLAATEPARVLTSSIGQLVAETWPVSVAAPATGGGAVPAGRPGPGRAWAGRPPDVGNTCELAAALAGVLCGLARSERVLVVLEDLHWATSDLLEVATTLVADGCRSEGQLAYLGISRPELPGLPGWLLEDRTQRIDLDPLGEQPVAELFVSVLGADAEPGLAGRVFEHSKGNLFVKELAIALREADGFEVDYSRCPSSTPPGPGRGQVDRLPLSAKRVLCRQPWLASGSRTPPSRPWPSRVTAR